MRRLIATLLCCLGFAAHAGTTDAALLQSVLGELGKHSAVRAEFSQTRSNPALSQPQVSSGQLLFVLGHGMLWQVQVPYQETLALTGNHSARVDAQGQLQPMRNDRGVSQISQMLQSMLSGQPDEVLRQFDLQASGTAAQWTLHFTPKQERMARVLGSIELDGDAFLEGIRIDMQDGTSTRIRFSGARTAGALSALEQHALGAP
jgi:outer membrane lipoprotein carrier protein LolA